jgi:hypothetical protein
LGAAPSIDLSSPAPLNKGGNQFGAPHSKDLKEAVQDGNKQNTDRIVDKLEDLIAAIRGMPRPASNRNTAGRPSYFAQA